MELKVIKSKMEFRTDGAPSKMEHRDVVHSKMDLQTDDPQSKMELWADGIQGKIDLEVIAALKKLVL